MADRIARLEEMRKITGYSSVSEPEKRTALQLRNKKLTSVPLGVFDLTTLVELWLGQNQLSSLPSEILQLAGLTLLSVYNNQLPSLPPEILRLTKLNRLFVNSNQLSSLPPEISQLKGLAALDVGNNKLWMLPSGISKLTNITYLNISQNKISSIPNMHALMKLKKLDVQQTAFPAHVQHFLHSFEVEENKIQYSGKGLKKIPQEMFLLPTHPKIDLSNNQIFLRQIK